MTGVRRWLAEPPRDLVALAAVVAAALVALGALSAVALLSSDFPLPLAERFQRATTTVRTSVPLLLVAALVLAEREPAAVPAPSGSPGQARRLVAPGTLAVAAVAGALLVGRTVADVAAGRPGAAGARLDEVLVDLGALVLTVAAGWWAARAWADATEPVSGPG